MKLLKTEICNRKKVILGVHIYLEDNEVCLKISSQISSKTREYLLNETEIEYGGMKVLANDEEQRSSLFSSSGGENVISEKELKKSPSKKDYSDAVKILKDFGIGTSVKKLSEFDTKMKLQRHVKSKINEKLRFMK